LVLRWHCADAVPAQKYIISESIADQTSQQSCKGSKEFSLNMRKKRKEKRRRRSRKEREKEHPQSQCPQDGMFNAVCRLSVVGPSGHEKQRYNCTP